MTERLERQIAITFNQRAETARKEQQLQKNIFENKLFGLFEQGIKPEDLSLLDIARLLGIDIPQALLEAKTGTVQENPNPDLTDEKK